MLKKTPIYLAAVLLMGGCTSNKFLHQRYTNFKKGGSSNTQPVAKVQHLKAHPITEITKPQEVLPEVTQSFILVAEAPVQKGRQTAIPSMDKPALIYTQHSNVEQIKFKALADKKEVKKEKKKFIFGLINSVLGLVLTILIIILVVALILFLI